MDPDAQRLEAPHRDLQRLRERGFVSVRLNETKKTEKYKLRVREGRIRNVEKQPPASVKHDVATTVGRGLQDQPLRPSSSHNTSKEP